MDLGTIKAESNTEMAQIVAELVRQGITFDVTKDTSRFWLITLTGGS